jgi:ornithine carbamoyltransferase
MGLDGIPVTFGHVREGQKRSQRKRHGGAGRIDMIVKQAGRDVLVMNGLPTHRGGEITDEVIDGPHSIAWD